MHRGGGLLWQWRYCPCFAAALALPRRRCLVLSWTPAPRHPTPRPGAPVPHRTVCAALHCTVCCAVLCCAALRCTVWRYSALCVPCGTALRLLHCTAVLCCAVLHCVSCAALRWGEVDVCFN